jgi:hypothetical protein
MDLDKRSIDIACPQCSVTTPVYFRQVRTRDAVICRGCLCTIRLEDNMNTVRKARRQIRAALAKLTAQFSRTIGF